MNIKPEVNTEKPKDTNPKETYEQLSIWDFLDIKEETK